MSIIIANTYPWGRAQTVQLRYWKIFQAVAAAFFALGLSSSVSAQISNLFNTGVNNSGAPLPVLSQDTHYFLTASADPNCPITLPPRVEGLGNTWVNTNNAISGWIRPEQTFSGFPPFNNYGICSNGSYIYRTTFNVGANAAVTILGQAAADDLLTGIALNGGTPVPMSANFAAYQNFTISTGFQANAVNTLDFFVMNLGGAPTGLRVEMVPEPMSGGLAVLGCIGLFLSRRARGQG